MSNSRVPERVIAWCATCGKAPPRPPDEWQVGTRYRCNEARIDNFHVAAIIPESMKCWLSAQAALVRFFRSDCHPRNFRFIRGQAERYGVLVLVLMAVAIWLGSLGSLSAWAGAIISGAVILDLLAYNTMVAFVTQHPQVPMRNALFGIAGFAVIALGYSVFYVGLVPHCFSRKLDVWEAVYFSFVTVTTLGDGNITLAQNATAAKYLVVGEVITGLFYLAVLLTTMVGWANAPTALQTEQDLGLRPRQHPAPGPAPPHPAGGVPSGGAVDGDDGNLLELRTNYWLKRLDHTLTHTQTASRLIYVIDGAVLALMYFIVQTLGASRQVLFLMGFPTLLLMLLNLFHARLVAIQRSHYVGTNVRLLQLLNQEDIQHQTPRRYFASTHGVYCGMHLLIAFFLGATAVVMFLYGWLGWFADIKMPKAGS